MSLLTAISKAVSLATRGAKASATELNKVGLPALAKGTNVAADVVGKATGLEGFVVKPSTITGGMIDAPQAAKNFRAAHLASLQQPHKTNS